MQSLMSGADCSSASNPLKQVLQREGVDNSLFRDRLATTAGPSAQHPFRSFPAGASSSPNAAVHAKGTSHAFNLSYLSAALAGPSARPSSEHLEANWNQARGQVVQRPQKLLGPPQPSSFGAEYAQWNGSRHAESGWADSYHLDGKGKGRAATPNQLQSQLQPRTYTPQYPYQSYQSPLQPMYPNVGYDQPRQANGRSEQEQKEMEAAFERALEDARLQTGVETSLNEQQEDVEEIIREPKGDFDVVWESLRPEAERLGKLAEWEKDFSQFTSDEDDLFDTLNDSLNRDGVGQTSLDDQLEFGTGQLFDGIRDADDGLPKARQYAFAQNNIFDNTTPALAWANHLSSGAALSDAALMLESFLRRATIEDYNQLGVTEVEAWSLLGRTHAMDEKEEKALSAFEEGKRALGPEDTGREKVTGELLTSLAISYVNESLDLAALSTLHQLLRILSPTHAGPAPSRASMTESTSPWALHQAMTDSFLALARSQYTLNGQVDPDVQVGLGTLYYMMEEYNDARGCWVAALGERPDDYLLWNRLGTTLANGGNPEEAVDAYRRALELNPTFTRAIFNLGVACLNIGVHREAAEHFLTALSLHEQQAPNGMDAQINESGSLWTTLRRALIALEMPDLANLAKPGTDLQVFRQAGFEY